jgi:hypothetical protein
MSSPCPTHCECDHHRATVALETFDGWPHVPDPGQQDETQTWREYFLALFVLGVVSGALLAVMFVLWSLSW